MKNLKNKLFRKKNYNRITGMEVPLLKELKNNHPLSYIRAMHVSHYSAAIAARLKLDELLVKADAQYSCILSLFDGNRDKFYYLAEDFEFPEELLIAIRELNDDSLIFSSTESFVVALSKTFVLALIKIINSGKDAKLAYNSLVDKVIDVYYNSGRMKDLELSFKDLEIIRDVMKSEKKYLKIISE